MKNKVREHYEHTYRRFTDTVYAHDFVSMGMVMALCDLDEGTREHCRCRVKERNNCQATLCELQRHCDAGILAAKAIL